TALDLLQAYERVISWFKEANRIFAPVTQNKYPIWMNLDLPAGVAVEAVFGVLPLRDLAVSFILGVGVETDRLQAAGPSWNQLNGRSTLFLYLLIPPSAIAQLDQ